MTVGISLSERVAPVGRSGAGVLVLLALVVLPWSPAPLLGQQDTIARLDRGDRVRVWRSGAGWAGREFDVREWRGDTLVLTEPDTIGVARLPSTEIDRLQLQRETGGTYLLEGALIGGGVGVVPIAILSARECSGPDYQGGPGCTIGFMMEGPILLGIVPGALVGGAIGLLIPDREWVSIEPGPPIRGGSPGPATGRGASVAVRLRVPPDG